MINISQIIYYYNYVIYKNKLFLLLSKLSPIIFKNNSIYFY